MQKEFSDDEKTIRRDSEESGARKMLEELAEKMRKKRTIPKPKTEETTIHEDKSAKRYGHRLNPSNAPTHNNLGNIYAEQERNREAIKEFQEALKLNPKLPLPTTISEITLPKDTNSSAERWACGSQCVD